MSAIGSAGVITGFNNFPSIDPTRPIDAVEILFGGYENRVAPILNRLVGSPEENWPLTEKDRGIFAEFLATCRLRTLDIRRQLEAGILLDLRGASAEDLTDIGIEPDDMPITGDFEPARPDAETPALHRALFISHHPSR